MPATRLAQFNANIRRARDLVGLGQAVGALTVGLVDASDMYRAALVQAVAALDSYVHGVVLDRAVAILVGSLATLPGGSRKVGLPFSAVESILSAPTPVDREMAARTHIAQRLALETFQKADDIAAALAMVGVPKCWSSAFPADPAGAKTAIGLVVQRRDRIVHQCDADPLTPGTVTPLTDDDALASIDTIDATVAALDPLC